MKTATLHEHSNSISSGATLTASIWSAYCWGRGEGEHVLMLLTTAQYSERCAVKVGSFSENLSVCDATQFL